MLDRIRPKEDVRLGITRLEVDAIDEAVQYDCEKSPWIDLIVGDDLPLFRCGHSGFRTHGCVGDC